MTEGSPTANASGPAARHRAGWRRLLAALSMMLWGLVALVTAALLVLQTDWGRELVRQVVQDAINDAIAGEVLVERLEGNPLIHIGLVGVEIRDPDGNTVARADRIDTGVNLLALTAQTISLGPLILENAKVSGFDDEGRLGLARAFAPAVPVEEEPTAPSPWRLEIEDIIIREGALARSYPGPSPLRVRDLALAASVYQSRDGIAWEEFEVSGKTEGLPFDHFVVRTKGRLAGTSAELELLEVEAGPHRMRVTGALYAADTGEFDARIEELRVDLEQLSRRLPLPALLGSATLTGRAHGRVTDMQLELALETLGGRIQLAGRGGWRDDRPELDLGVVGTRLRPHALLADIDTPLTAALAGRIRLSGWPLAEASSLTASLRAMDLAGLENLPREVSVDATLAGEHVRLTLQGGRLRAHASGDVSGPFTVTAELQEVDLAPWSRLALIDGLSGEVHAASMRAMVWLAERGPPTIDLAGAIDAEHLRIPVGGLNSVDARRVTADLDITWPGAGLPLGSLGFRLAEGRIGAAGSGEVDAKLEIRSELAGAYRVSGRLGGRNLADEAGLSIDRLTAPLDLVLVEGDWRPSGRADVTVSGARLGRLQLGRLHFDARYVPRLRQGKLELVATGRLEIDQLAPAPGVRLASLSRGALRLVIDSELAVSGDISAGLRGLVAGSLSVGAAELADVTFATGADGVLRLRGQLTAQGSRIGEDFRVAKLRVPTLDLRLGGGFPAGTVTFESEGLGFWQRDLARLDGVVELGPDARIDVRAERRPDVILDLSVALPTRGRRRLELKLRHLELSRVAGADAGKLAGRSRGFRIRDGHLAIGTNGAIKSNGLRVEAIGRDFDGEIDARIAYQPRGKAPRGKVSMQGVRAEQWLAAARDITGLELPESLPARGTVRKLVAHLGGTAARPQVDFDLEVADVKVRQMRIPKLALAGHYRSGWLRIRKGRARFAGRASVEVDDLNLPLRLSLSPPAVALGDLRRSHGDLRVHDVDLSLFNDWIPRPFGAPDTEGVVSLVLSVAPRPTPRVEAWLRGRDITYAQLEHVGICVHTEIRRRKPYLVVDVIDSTGVPICTDPDNPALKPEHRILVALRPGGRLDRLLSGAPLIDTLEEARREELTGRIFLRETKLREVPWLSGLGQLAELAIDLDLEVAGKPSRGRWVSGHARVAHIPFPGGEARAELGFLPVGNLRHRGTTVLRTETTLSLAAGDRILAEGIVRMPNLEQRFEAGSGLLQLLEDPELLVRVRVQPMQSDGLVVFDPDLAGAVQRLLPEGWLSAELNVRGGKAGPVGRLLVQLERRRRGSIRSLYRAITLSSVLEENKLAASLLVDQGTDGGVLAAHVELAAGWGALLADELDTLLERELRGHLRTTDLNLAQVTLLAPSLFGPATRGTAAIDLALGGTLRHPTVTGQLLAEFDVFSMTGLGFEQRDLRLGFYIADGGAMLLPVRVDDERGKLDVELAIDLNEPLLVRESKGALPYRLNPDALALRGALDMQRYRLFNRDDIKAEASTVDREKLEKGVVERKPIVITGTLARPKIDGAVRLDKADIDLGRGRGGLQPVGLPPDVVFVDDSGRMPPIIVQDRPTKVRAFPAEVKLLVTIPRGAAHVYNPLLNVKPFGSLAMYTDEQRHLRLDGKIYFFGRLDLYGATLELPEGDQDVAGQKMPRSYIDFTGDPRIQPPRIVVRADYDISHVDLSPIGKEATDGSKLTLVFEGDTDHDLALVSHDSDPAGISKSEAVSILAFGTPVGAGGGGGQITQRVSQALLSVMGLSRSLKEAKLIESLDLSVSDEDVRLSVGRSISRHVWLHYDLDLGAPEGENKHEVRVEFRLGKRWRLETRAGDAGKGALDLLWRHSF